jgi:four helix bundle protein
MQKLPPARSFEELIVWQKSHRRSAVSVPANIAEGFKKRGRPDKARVMNIAQASLEELRYYFLLSRDLGYLKEIERERVDEVARLLGAYTRSLLSSTS